MFACGSGLRALSRCRLWLASLSLLFLSLGLTHAAETNTAKPVFHTGMKSASAAAALDQSLVLLVFSADWCVPCHHLKDQTLDSREFQEQGGALHLADIDVDVEKAIAGQFGISAMPTLVLLTPDGKIVSHREGFLRTAELLLWIKEGRELAKQGKWQGTTPGTKLAEFTAKIGAEGLDTNDLSRLIALLGDADPSLRADAGKLVSAQRELALPPLLDALTNSYLGIRIAAGDLFHQLAPDTALIDAWQNPADLQAAVAGLRKWWTDTGKLPAPRESSGIALTSGSLNAALDALRGDDPVRRTEAMSTLVHQGPAALPAVRDVIKASERAGDQRALSLFEDILWSILVPDDLEHRSGGVRHILSRGKGQERQTAATRLGRAGPAAIPPLAELLNDSDPLVVESAVRALSGIGGKDAIPAMAALLKAADSNLRMTAAQALGHTKNLDATKPLLTVLDDPNEVVACTALSGLEEVNSRRSYSGSKREQPPELVAGLKSSLADPRWRVRAAAAEVIGKLQASELLSGLQHLLDDPDGFVVKNALAALRALSGAPDAAKLIALAERHPGLRGEAVELLVNQGSEEGVRTVGEMYSSATPEARLMILRSLANAPVQNDQTSVTNWQPLLARAAAETDPRLRRATAELLGAHSPKVAAAIIAPLLSDEDVETRAAAAAVVLSIIGGERPVKSGHGQTVFSQFDFTDSDGSSPSSNRKSSKTNKPPFSSEQLAAWHTAIQLKAGTAPDLLTAGAIYVTGPTNEGLPALQAALERADKSALTRFANSSALSAILPRLTLPEANTFLDRLGASPSLFLRAATYAQKLLPQLSDYFLQPERFRAAAERASAADLDPVLSQLLSSDRQHWSFLSFHPGTDKVLLALVDSTNAAWRAAAIYGLGQREDQKDLSLFERAARDSNAWVRAASVAALARKAKDRSYLEAQVGPLVGDGQTNVAQRAALALLEPETLAAAQWGYYLSGFQFENIHAWGDYNSPSDRDQRSLSVIESKPAFLDHARHHLTSASAHGAIPFALLLAQYGDFSGVDRLVQNSSGEEEKEANSSPPALAAIALSRDSKYLPYLKKLAAVAQNEWSYRQILQALKGMTGSEAREFRLEINKRMRQAGQ